MSLVVLYLDSFIRNQLNLSGDLWAWVQIVTSAGSLVGRKALFAPLKHVTGHCHLLKVRAHHILVSRLNQYLFAPLDLLTDLEVFFLLTYNVDLALELETLLSFHQFM